VILVGNVLTPEYRDLGFGVDYNQRLMHWVKRTIIRLLRSAMRAAPSSGLVRHRFSFERTSGTREGRLSLVPGTHPTRSIAGGGGSCSVVRAARFGDCLEFPRHRRRQPWNGLPDGRV
jgi:hypothetical protein